MIVARVKVSRGSDPFFSMEKKLVCSSLELKILALALNILERLIKSYVCKLYY